MRANPRSSNDSPVQKEYSPLELAEMKTGRRFGQIHRAAGLTSRKRIKLEDQAACYHVMSRTVNGEFLLGALEKEAFRRMMWRMASFSGVEILTYCLMDNHFHILLKVPERKKWLRKFEGKEGEQNLLEHLKSVYSKVFMAQLQREIEGLREAGNEEGVQELLGRFKKRFCDVSLFVKELKERFSRWYNQQNGRRGTLWMDRFKSVLVGTGEALEAMAAYIDLNPIRAGMVKDPALYEWSGYGEAVGGSRRAKRGICKVVGVPQDRFAEHAQPSYRSWLYQDGKVVSEDRQEQNAIKEQKGFDSTKVLFVKTVEKGHLSRKLLLRKRVSTFSNGVAIGGKDFVKGVAEKYRLVLGRKREKRRPRFGGGEEGEKTAQKRGFYAMRE